MANNRSTQKTIVLDIFHDQMISKVRKGQNALRPICPVQLQIEKKGGAQSGRTRMQHKVEIASSTRALLRKLQTRVGLENCTIVLGETSDPFYPHRDKFENALKVLELLALYKPKQLIIQTRSALVMLALPILSSFGDSVDVTIAVEAVNDKDNKRYTPHLPRPSERIKAARTLKSVGIKTTIQIAPLMQRGSQELELLEFASVIDDVSDSIVITDYHKLIKQRSFGKKTNQSSDTLDPLARTYLKVQLERIASHKLIDPAIVKPLKESGREAA